MSRHDAARRAGPVAPGSRRVGRSGYLVGAVCVALCTVMLLPLLVSVLASVKPTAEAAASPPTYLPHALSLDSYERLWNYQQGLPTYLFNSLGTALLTIVFTLAAHRAGRVRAGPVPDAGQGGHLRRPAAGADRAVPGAADADVPDVRQGRPDQLAGRPGDRAHRDPAAVQPLRAAQQLRRRAARAGGGGHHGRRHARARRCAGSSCPSTVPAIVTVALFAFIMSWNEFLGALVMMSKGSTFTLPLVLAAARTETSLGGTDWGMLQAGITISIVPCVARLPPAAAVLRVRPDERSGQMSAGDRCGSVQPSPAQSALRPIGAGAGRPSDDGFWAERLRVNRERTIPHGFAQLRRAGTLDNLRLAAGADGQYRALGRLRRQHVLPFLDSDVYKWLEAVGWELGRGDDPGLRGRGRRGDRASWPRPSAPTATSTASSQVVRDGAAVHATWPGATSSTASAT